MPVIRYTETQPNEHYTMTDADTFAGHLQTFEALAARAEKLDNFLNIEQMFLDAQIYLPQTNTRMIAIAGELHLTDPFIREGTTPTQVFFEIYRRAMFVETVRFLCTSTERDMALDHLERLVTAGEAEAGARGDNVINLFRG